MTSTPRTVWIGTSWKMNFTLDEARAFVDRLCAEPIPTGVQAFVLPPHTALAVVRDRLPPAAPILLGAQNAHWAAEGSWTGEISMRMAADAGARLIEMGHSERRQHFGETDETVAAKAAAAHAHGLTPLICVGEPLDVREQGGADRHVAGQVRAALSRLRASEIGASLLAYEPIWAIGESGRPASPAEIAPVLRVIAETVAELTGGGRLLGLLYGGSVTAANAAELLRIEHTDGLFVGRAAWQPDGFRELLATAARHVR